VEDPASLEAGESGASPGFGAEPRIVALPRAHRAGIKPGPAMDSGGEEPVTGTAPFVHRVAGGNRIDRAEMRFSLIAKIRERFFVSA